MKSFLLYCPKCKQETLIDVNRFVFSVCNDRFLSKIAYNLSGSILLLSAVAKRVLSPPHNKLITLAHCRQDNMDTSNNQKHHEYGKEQSPNKKLIRICRVGMISDSPGMRVFKAIKRQPWIALYDFTCTGPIDFNWNQLALLHVK